MSAIDHRWPLVQQLLGQPLHRGFLDSGEGEFLKCERGTLYCTQSTEARILTGLIENHWVGDQALRQQLGYPVTDHTQGPDGQGWLCYFQRGCLHLNGQSLPELTDDLAKAVHLHLKVLDLPQPGSVDLLIDLAQHVFDTAGIVVEKKSNERLDGPSHLESLSVESCKSEDLTVEQIELFSHRNNVADGDLVAYFVEEIVPPQKGCAAHPDGMPGAVIQKACSPWTLAHEIGHVLGLAHHTYSDYLMTDEGTHVLQGLPFFPKLSASEVEIIRNNDTFLYDLGETA